MGRTFPRAGNLKCTAQVTSPNDQFHALIFQWDRRGPANSGLDPFRLNLYVGIQHAFEGFALHLLRVDERGDSLSEGDRAMSRRPSKSLRRGEVFVHIRRHIRKPLGLRQMCGALAQKVTPGSHRIYFGIPHAGKRNTDARQMSLILAHVFDRWVSSPEHPTLYLLDRTVLVDMQAAMPGIGRRMDGVALWCRSSALRIEPFMTGRQIAWVRRFDGGFLAVVEIVAGSANGRSAVTMQLWLEPHMITPVDDGLEPRSVSSGGGA